MIKYENRMLRLFEQNVIESGEKKKQGCSVGETFWLVKFSNHFRDVLFVNAGLTELVEFLLNDL